MYIADWTGHGLGHKMDHLACFSAGMLMIGAQDGHRFAGEYVALAEQLTLTCEQMYKHTATGLSPEYVQFSGGRDMTTPKGASGRAARAMSMTDRCPRCTPSKLPIAAVAP